MYEHIYIHIYQHIELYIYRIYIEIYNTTATCVCLRQAQKEAGECHIQIPVITFDSLEDGQRAGQEGAESDEEPSPRLSQSTVHSEEFHLCRETTSSESHATEAPPGRQPRAPPPGLRLGEDSDNMLSPLLTNDNSSSGVDVHSHHDDSDPPELNVDSEGFLRLPRALGRYGPGGRTHVRGLSMDSGTDAVLLSERSHNAVHTVWGWLGGAAHCVQCRGNCVQYRGNCVQCGGNCVQYRGNCVQCGGNCTV